MDWRGDAGGLTGHQAERVNRVVGVGAPHGRVAAEIQERELGEVRQPGREHAAEVHLSELEPDHPTGARVGGDVEPVRKRRAFVKPAFVREVPISVVAVALFHHLASVAQDGVV